MIKTKEIFQIALIGWIKAGPPKKPLLFWSCKQTKWHWFTPTRNQR